MNEDDQNWDNLISGLRAGDSLACGTFWEKYGPLLEAVAQRQLSQRIQRRVGADDVVQSACRTFFRRVSDGQFELPDADALWRLMCAITLTKARRAARDQNRQKRGVSKEEYIDSAKDSVERRQYDVAGGESTPLEAAEVADQLQSVLEGLGPEECQVLDLKLQQFTNDEIAQRMNCSERTVRRLTKKIQDRWTNLMDQSS